MTGERANDIYFAVLLSLLSSIVNAYICFFFSCLFRCIKCIALECCAVFLSSLLENGLLNDPAETIDG